VEAIFGEEHASLLQYGIDYGLKSFRVHASCANALVHNNMQDLQKKIAAGKDKIWQEKAGKPLFNSKLACFARQKVRVWCSRTTSSRVDLSGPVYISFMVRTKSLQSS